MTEKLAANHDARNRHVILALIHAGVAAVLASNIMGFLNSPRQDLTDSLISFGLINIRMVDLLHLGLAVTVTLLVTGALLLVGRRPINIFIVSSHQILAIIALALIGWTWSRCRGDFRFLSIVPFFIWPWALSFSTILCLGRDLGGTRSIQRVSWAILMLTGPVVALVAIFDWPALALPAVMAPGGFHTGLALIRSYESSTEERNRIQRELRKMDVAGASLRADIAKISNPSEQQQKIAQLIQKALSINSPDNGSAMVAIEALGAPAIEPLVAALNAATPQSDTDEMMGFTMLLDMGPQGYRALANFVGRSKGEIPRQFLRNVNQRSLPVLKQMVDEGAPNKTDLLSLIADIEADLEAQRGTKQ